MACNESSDFQEGIYQALQRLATPTKVFKTFNTPLALRTQDSVSRDYGLLILDANFPG